MSFRVMLRVRALQGQTWNQPPPTPTQKVWETLWTQKVGVESKRSLGVQLIANVQFRENQSAAG